MSSSCRREEELFQMKHQGSCLPSKVLQKICSMFSPPFAQRLLYLGNQHSVTCVVFPVYPNPAVFQAKILFCQPDHDPGFLDKISANNSYEQRLVRRNNWHLLIKHVKCEGFAHHHLKHLESHPTYPSYPLPFSVMETFAVREKASD